MKNYDREMVIGFKNGLEACIPYTESRDAITIIKSPDGVLKKVGLSNLYFVDTKNVDYIYTKEID